MLSPYSYHYNERTKSYHFNTKNNLEYRVAFVVDHTFSAVSNLEINDVFQVVIEKFSDENERLDGQVGATINAIIALFFQNVQQSILYICDDQDNKAAQRFKTFERWYQNSAAKDAIHKEDNVVSFYHNGQEEKIYSSLLLHRENRNRQVILEIYHTIQEVLNEK